MPHLIVPGSGGGGSPWPIRVPGRYYEPLNSFGAVSSDFSLTVAIDRFMLVPFFSSQAFVMDQIGIEVLNPVLSSNIKMVLYRASLTTGLPDELILETSNISTASGTGYRYAECEEQIEAGMPYWMGGRYSHAIQVRSQGTAQSVNVLGVSSATGTNKTMFGLNKSLTFATAAPAVGTDHFAWTDSHNANGLDRPIFRVGSV